MQLSAHSLRAVFQHHAFINCGGGLYVRPLDPRWLHGYQIAFISLRQSINNIGRNIWIVSIFSDMLKWPLLSRKLWNIHLLKIATLIKVGRVHRKFRKEKLGSQKTLKERWKLVHRFRLVFSNDESVVGVVIRSAEWYNLIKIKPTKSEPEYGFRLWLLRPLWSSENLIVGVGNRRIS